MSFFCLFVCLFFVLFFCCCFYVFIFILSYIFFFFFDKDSIYIVNIRKTKKVQTFIFVLIQLKNMQTCSTIILC